MTFENRHSFNVLQRLSVRMIGLITLAALLGAGLVSWVSKDVLEETMLEGAKRQALVFLSGLEHEMMQLPDPTDRQALQKLVEYRGTHHLKLLDFSVLDLYVFNERGEVLARLLPAEPGPKAMEPYLSKTLETSQPYLADETEYYQDPHDGVMRPKADVVLPVSIQGLGVVGLEVEIGLTQTLAMIDQRVTQQMQLVILLTIVVAVIMTLFISWVVYLGLIRPVNLLERVTARIAAGELEARIDVDLANNELGRLGRAVNLMAEGLQRLIREQEDAYLQMMQSLAKALEAKDAYTASHSARVAKFSVRLARRLGFSEERLKVLKQGAMMHDLGKIGISDAVLNKPSALTDSEYETIQKHPVYTAAIMRPLKQLREHAEIAAWHHERWDGRGYPDGLKGEAIPLAARIVAIADTWDAMTGDRVYRKGMPAEQALAILERERNSGQFDPRLLDAFFAMIRDEQEAHQTMMRTAGLTPIPG